MKLINLNFKRRASSWTKLSNLYQNIWNPSAPKPPYHHVCQLGDPILRQKALPVAEEDITSKGIADIVSLLRSMMKKYNAAGLSAPQIGLPARIFTVEFPESSLKHFPPEIIKAREMVALPFQVFINPEVSVKNYHKVIFPEACESVKGLSASVARYREIKVAAYDLAGKKFEWEAVGWPARIVQHEMDHLDGKLYVDIMDSKTLQFNSWYTINVRGGKFKLKFDSD